jgi:3-oxoacyl-[acyl-carrier protein] reductase
MVDSGAFVFLLGRTLSRLKVLEEELGERALAVECDVKCPYSVRHAFLEMSRHRSSIDVLINNAATYEPFYVEAGRDDQILEPILTNLAGPFYVTREALQPLKRGGHIINISSESVGMNFPMLSLYQSTKAGLERFTAALQQEVQPQGIKVTLVRAGTMYDEDTTAPWPPNVHVPFAEACLKAGIDLRARPVTHYRSVAEIIYQVIASPADVNVPVISLEGFRA